MSTIVHRHPHGRGAVVEVHGQYRFLTRGMTDDEIAAKHDSIVAQHAAKSERHDGFNQMERAVDGFHIHGLAITEQGTDVRLILRVTTPEGSILKLDRVAPTVADLPSDAEIHTIVRAAAGDWLASQTELDNHVESVKAALGATMAEGRA